MYNLRRKIRKGEYSSEQISYHYSSGDMADKTMKIILNRMPLLDNPSNHNCIFQVKNGNKVTIKKNEDLGSREKIIVFLILFSFFISVILAMYYKDECKTYGNNLGKRLVLLANKLGTLNTPFFNTLYAMYNKIFREKRFGSMLKNQKRLHSLKRRSDMCYNDIRDFIKEDWITVEEKISHESLSFIEEQCRMLNIVPKIADHVQFSFNNTGLRLVMDVNSLTDYASYDKGARILSTSGTEAYVEYKIQSGILQYILGIKYFKVDELPICRISETLCRHVPSFFTGPFSLLQPWKKPGDCWAFKGTRGRVQIELAERIFITAVSLEHIPPQFAATESIQSAPAQFSIIGIDTEGYKFTTRRHLGTYRYLLSEPNIQTFILSKEDSFHSYKIIEFIVESNHGNENYTCVYRLRVHGRPANSLSN